MVSECNTRSRARRWAATTSCWVLVDFTVTARQFTEAQADELDKKSRKFKYAPLTASGVALGFNMRNPQTGEKITELKLTPELVAEIFTGQMYNLNSDQRVRDLNPGVQFPPGLRAVGRADSSAATYTFTSFLNATAKEAFEKGGDAYKDGTHRELSLIGRYRSQNRRATHCSRALPIPLSGTLHT